MEAFIEVLLVQLVAIALQFALSRVVAWVRGQQAAPVVLAAA